MRAAKAVEIKNLKINLNFIKSPKKSPQISPNPSDHEDEKFSMLTFCNYQEEKNELTFIINLHTLRDKKKIHKKSPIERVRKNFFTHGKISISSHIRKQKRGDARERKRYVKKY